MTVVVSPGSAEAEPAPANYQLANLFVGESARMTSGDAVVKMRAGTGETNQVWTLTSWPTPFIKISGTDLCITAIQSGPISAAQCETKGGQIWEFRDGDGSYTIRNTLNIKNCLTAEGVGAPVYSAPCTNPGTNPGKKKRFQQQRWILIPQ
ncbi:RICIN domain-containing protein [Nocardia sp. NPDC127579]|uniref:RICIN domain-containing protein n=1 Tax=Nocardia sp. NPDC127579 TaxID=3345402 RepID=UPI003640BEC0